MKNDELCMFVYMSLAFWGYNGVCIRHDMGQGKAKMVRNTPGGQPSEGRMHLSGWPLLHGLEMGHSRLIPAVNAT